MIKLFVTDLDGTLLNENHEMSDANKEAISKLRKAGISFIPASDRDYIMLMSIIDQVGKKPKAICLNGGEFYDNSGQIISRIPIKHSIMNKIEQIIEKYHVDVDYYTEDGRYVNIPESYIFDLLLARYYSIFDESDKQKLINFIENNNILQDIYCEPELRKIIHKPMIKVELMMANQNQRSKAFKELKKIDGIITTSAFSLNLEINAAEATKGNMLENICKYYGYDEDEVVVMGDGLNDISMLKKFNNSFAMGQASDEVKRYATYEAPSCSENGVAYVANMILSNNKNVPD